MASGCAVTAVLDLSGVYNLNGGLLQTAKIIPTASTGAEAFNFSGGTLLRTTARPR